MNNKVIFLFGIFLGCMSVSNSFAQGNVSASKPWIAMEICLRLAANHHHQEQEISPERSVSKASNLCSEKIDAFVQSLLASDEIQRAREKGGLSSERAERLIRDTQVFEAKIKILRELEGLKVEQ